MLDNTFPIARKKRQLGEPGEEGHRPPPLPTPPTKASLYDLSIHVKNMEQLATVERNLTLTERIKRYWSDFANVSQIDGLCYIVNSSCRLEQFMWTSLITVCIVLTVNDLSGIVASYQREDTTAEINIVSSNATVEMKYPEIRLEIQNFFSNEQVLFLHENATSTEALLARLNSSQALEAMANPRQWNWDDGRAEYDNDTVRLLRLTLHMLRYIEVWRYATIHGLPTTTTNERGILSKVYKFYRDIAKASMADVERSAGSPANCSTLLKAFNLAMLCYLAAMRGMVEGHNNLCKKDYITGLNVDGRGVLQMRIRPFDWVVKTDRGGLFWSEMNMSSLLSTFPDEFAETKDIGNWTVAFVFDESEADSPQNLVRLNQNAMYRVDVRTTAHLKQLSTTRQPCSTVESSETCRANCIENAFRQQHCGCYLSSQVVSTDNNTKLCSDIALTDLRRFENWKTDYAWIGCIYQAANDADRSCTANCTADSCETILFDFATTVMRQNTPGNAATNLLTYACFYVEGSKYPEFRERLSMDRYAFFSALGGVLSLYIGASFLALCHFVVYVIRAWLELRNHVSCGKICNECSPRYTVFPLPSKLRRILSMMLARREPDLTIAGLAQKQQQLEAIIKDLVIEQEVREMHFRAELKAELSKLLARRHADDLDH